MGVFKVHRIKDFVLLAKLVVGGGIITERDGMLMLDNGYVLLKYGVG